MEKKGDIAIDIQKELNCKREKREQKVKNNILEWEQLEKKKAD